MELTAVARVYASRFSNQAAGCRKFSRKKLCRHGVNRAHTCTHLDKGYAKCFHAKLALTSVASYQKHNRVQLTVFCKRVCPSEGLACYGLLTSSKALRRFCGLHLVMTL